MPMQPTPIAIAVVEQEGRFLVGMRPEGVPLAGYAEFPGGKVRADETIDATACRECREEAGLEVVPSGPPEIVDWQYDHGAVRLHFVPCRVVAAREPRAPFRWVERSELALLSFPPANAALVASLVGRDAATAPRRGEPL
jgi:8-oxo-dGTP diphosphatase